MADKVIDFVNYAAQTLADIHPEECRLLAELLVSRSLSCPRLELPLRYRDQLPASLLPGLKRDLSLLRNGLPWQYLLGSVEFFGRIFKSDSRALIPRPETELFTEWVLSCLPKGKPLFIAEVGAGSGCVLLTIAAELPLAKGLGLDISPAALALAAENASLLRLTNQTEFKLNDLLDGIPDKSLDAVVSNPPYLTVAEWENLPKHIRDYEPVSALAAGESGMQTVSRLLPQAAKALKPKGSLFLEFAPARLSLLREQLESTGFTDIKTHNDYFGRPHFIAGKLAGTN